MRAERFVPDLLAGFSVALVLIPQSLAYAELAGVPAPIGLIAAALPPVAAAFFASSPWLQTGPTALTAILAFGVLSTRFEPGTEAYLAAAALLALLVGAARVLLGLARMGTLAYFMSRPVLRGFTSAAALLILLSQLPTALGLVPPGDGIVRDALWSALNLPRAPWPAPLLALATIAVIRGARLLHPRVPGVLIAVVLGALLAPLAERFGGAGATLGTFAIPLAPPSLALPWEATPSLLLGALVIAAIGFAEPAAIARSYAREQEGAWNPNRELVSQGVANLAAGLFGAFPVGGSFSRSSLNRLAGARSRWSGLVTGLAVLAFLPAAGLLAPLPNAVLAGIVIAAVVDLFEIRALVAMWRMARFQALSAYATFGLTLLFAPRIDWAVLAGIGLAVMLHLWRETQLAVRVDRAGDTVDLELSGVLFFASIHHLEAAAREVLPPAEGVRRLRVDGSGLGRVDLSGSMALAELIESAEAAGLDLDLIGLEPYMERVLDRVRDARPEDEERS